MWSGINPSAYFSTLYCALNTTVCFLSSLEKRARAAIDHVRDSGHVRPRLVHHDGLNAEVFSERI